MSIVRFGFGDLEEGDFSKEILGGKGMALFEMSSLGIPVPPGVIIPCSTCVDYMAGSVHDRDVILKEVSMEVLNALEALQFHCELDHIPLVSVRSGARVSMPGMMDTILNVGLTAETLPFWRNKLGDRAALDSYRRLQQMYGSVALGVPMEQFDHLLEEAKNAAGVSSDSELSVLSLECLISEYTHLLSVESPGIPDTLHGQLWGAIKAVFESWNNPRAVEYRKINNIPDDWGTAVVVQSMVFGNLNDQSATGVVFSRCPSTGSPDMVGEFLVNAQGEDVVAGIRTPEPIHALSSWHSGVYHTLKEVVLSLEDHYRDMQDIEFTVQDGKLYILQTRSGKRTRQAAFKIASDLRQSKKISTKEMLARFKNEDIIMVSQPQIDPSFKTSPHFVGIAAGGPVVSGVAVFSAEEAVTCPEPCILVRKETDPNDIAGMYAAVGILTATGGLTSHAAVVARGMNKTCVVGATMMQIMGTTAVAGKGVAFQKGQKITIDGSSGKVWVGVDVPVLEGGMSPEVVDVVLYGSNESGAMVRVSPVPGDLSFGLFSHSPKGVHIDMTFLTQLPQCEEIAPFLSVVAKLAKTTRVVLDFTHVSAHYEEEDHVFATMFSASTLLSGASFAYSLLSGWDKELASKVTLVGATFPTELVAAGFNVVTEVSSLESLLDSKGPVVVPPSVVSSVFGGDKVFKKLKSMMLKAGHDFSGEMPKALYPYEMFGD